MRAFGALSPTELIETPPDTVITFLMTGGSSAQASDWPSSAAAFGANASTIGAHLCRVSGMTTAGTAQMGFMLNLLSTHATAPTSGSSVTTGTTAGSTGNSIPVFGSRYLQIPGRSTGFSVAFVSSGNFIMELWRK